MVDGMPAAACRRVRGSVGKADRVALPCDRLIHPGIVLIGRDMLQQSSRGALILSQPKSYSVGGVARYTSQRDSQASC